MIAGRLKYRLKLLRPASDSDSFGEQRAGNFEYITTVRAERVKFSASRRQEVAEAFSDYRVEFNIRAAHEVGEGWRVEELGGKLYEVVAIEPNPRRGFNKLICERVNT